VEHDNGRAFGLWDREALILDLAGGKLRKGH
jgi:hypothetical protein